MVALTDRTFRRKWTGKDEWLSDGGSRGAGRLVVKLTQSGSTFYYQYFLGERRRFLPIGPYDAKGERGKTLLQARDQAHELSTLYRSGVTDLHGHFEDLENDRKEERKRKLEESQRKAEEAKSSTLAQLLEAYVGHLSRLGKVSAYDAHNIFKSHVYVGAPKLAARRACDIEVDDFVALLAQLTQAGKGRTAGKLRSYLRAAYSLALKSKTDPDAPLEMRRFRITSNPIASISALSKYSRARDRVLNAEELAFFVERLREEPASIKTDAIMLGLMLGGQRPSQLLRARLVDLDLSAGTLTLKDPKGARQQPRVHVLPLTAATTAICRRLAERSVSLAEEDLKGPSPMLFTSDGKRPLRIETVSAVVTAIVDAMMKARELRERFEMRDLRRTCETMLAAMGVSSDVRAHLQSHGLGGVQTRHYDRHSYMDEKRKALELWEGRLGQHLETL